MTTGLHSITTVRLVGSHELDADVAVPMVVPVHKRSRPLAGLFHAGEWATWEVRPVFRCLEQRFGVWVVVADTRPREGTQDAQLLQTAFQHGRSHGVAIVSVENQRPMAALTDLLA